MQRVWVAGLLVALLFLPTAAAWSAHVVAPVDPELSTKTSLLVSGAITAVANGGHFGAPTVTVADFGNAASVCARADTSNATFDPSQIPGSGCTGGTQSNAARLRVISGGFVLHSASTEPVRLDAPAGVAILGGTNLTLNGMRPGPAVYVGGATTVRANGSTFTLRPLGADTSIEIRGVPAYRTYNGTGWTFTITNADGAFFDGPGGFLGLSQDGQLSVRPAPLTAAEEELRVDSVLATMHGVVRPENVDRRADLAGAFGPYQVVPPLLNGAVAAATNISLNDRAAAGFLLVKLNDGTLSTVDGNWTLDGNATSTIQGAAFSRDAGRPQRTPIIIPALLIVGALAGRLLTERETLPRRARLIRKATWIGAAAIVLLVASLVVGNLVGVSLLKDFLTLSRRSLAQLGLLVVGVTGVAALLVGVACASITRTFLTRRLPRATGFLAPIVGATATLLLVLIATPALTTLVARLVRL